MLQRCGVALLLVVGGSILPAHGQTKLEWKLNEGEKFAIETVGAMKQTMKGMGFQQKDDITQTSVSSFTVLKKNADGSVVLENKLESAKVEGGQAAATMNKLLDKLKGSTFRVTLSPTNNIVKVEGAEEAMKKIATGNPIADQMARGMMSEEALKSQYQEYFAFLPEKPVASGDQWERRATIPLDVLGSFKAVHRYQYRGAENSAGQKLEKITGISELAYVPPKPNQGGLLQVSKGNLNVESATAAYYFDAAAGKLARYETALHFKGSITAVVMNTNFEMEIEQEQHVKARLLDKAPGAK